MSNELLTSIIIGSVGFMLVSLFGAVGWFLVKSFATIEKNMEKHATLIGELTFSMKDIAGIIKSVEVQMTIRHDATQLTFAEHHEAIELVRTRIHYMFGKMGVLKWKIEEMGKIMNEMCEALKMKPFKAGFAEQEWELPIISIKIPGK